ncbi:MAG: RlmE family RNA methyltransferase [Alphaproteobacteria bacterium]|nr:MAG: hypothetical protein B6I23_02375 [Rickettsiaceae bacterium 4572_127]
MVRGVSRKKDLIKKNAKRTGSSTEWLKRQLNDPFVKKAKKEGVRCRASFKIQEIDTKFNVIKNGQTILDLGSAPGGWSEYIAEKNSRGKNVAIDLLEVAPIKNVIFKQGDFTDQKLQKWLGEKVGKADVILSDIAPNTTGIQSADHLRLMVILEDILKFSKSVLKKNGSLVAKTFRGGTDEKLLLELKKMFKTVKHFKPKSSRKDSVEMFVVAIGYHPPLVGGSKQPAVLGSGNS